MLSLFRGGGTAQIIVGGVVVTIILVFVLEFRAGRGSPTANLKQECAVSLSGECVTRKDFLAAFRLVVPSGAEPSVIRRMNLNSVVLDGLAERELLFGEAQRLGISIGEADVEKELTEGRARVSLPAARASRMAFQLGLCRRNADGASCEPGSVIGVRQLPVKNYDTKTFDYKVYERTVRNVTNRGPKEYKEMQRRELIADRMRDLVRSRVLVSEDEAFTAYARDRSRATIRTAALKRTWFARYAVDASTAAVDGWIATHGSDVDEAWKAEKDDWKESCPLVTEVLVSLGTGASDEDKVAGRAKIDRAKKLLADRVPFETVARKVGDGDASLVGGEVGCLTEKYPNGADELIEKVKSLKPGEVSDVIESGGGFHIVRLDGLLAAGDIEQVGRHHVGKRLAMNALADEAMKKYADGLAVRAKGGERLEDAVRVLSEQALAGSTKDNKKAAGKAASDSDDSAANSPDRPKVEISAPFNITGSAVPDADPGEAVAAKVFQLQKPDDLLPAPVHTPDGIVVVQLKEIDVAKREDFDKSRDEIMATLEQLKADDALARYVEDLKKRAGAKLKVNEDFGKAPKGNDEDG